MNIHSIRSKIRSLILVPLLALGIIAFFAFGLLSRREIAQRTSMDVRAAKSTLETFLSEKRKHLELETKLLAQVPYFKAAAQSHDRATTQVEVNQYFPSMSDGLILVTEGGTELASSGPLKGASPSTIAKLGWTSARDGKSWSGLVVLPKGLFLAATAPFMYGDFPKGAAICYSPMNDATLQTLAQQLSVQIAIVEGDKVVARSTSMKPFKLDGKTTGIYTQVGGEDYVGAYSAFRGAGDGTGFVTFRNANDIIGPSKLFLLMFFTLVALGFLLTAGLSEAFTRNLVRPLEGVVQAAIVLARGEYPEPFEVTRKDEIGLLQGVFNRMTRALQDHEQKLRAMIDIDPLTDLINHRRFKEQLSVELEKAESLSIVMLDIDHFSEFNSTKGMADGDTVLKACAALLLEITPEGAMVARYGGEEFALMIPSCELEDARALAESALAKFASLGFELTLSAGCAQKGTGTDQVGSLCLAAELALAQAKQLGRNQVSDFNTLAQDGTDPYQLNRFLQDGTIATIQALAAAVDAKDAYTKGHSQRVAEYAADLCRFVGGADSEVELVYRTGTLHDVGKIGVPDQVLNKPGPLTPEERAVMETHPALGEIIVRKVPQLADTLPGVRNHHERWDGKGYPDGLAGDAIPRLGRILAVADTYDAMTSDRPYRKGLPVEVALAEIAKNAGIQFEPTLAQAFVEMMSKHASQPKAA